MALSETALMLILDQAIRAAFGAAELIARIRAGVSDAEARPTPRAVIEARADRLRQQLLDDATVIGRKTEPT